MRRDLPGDDLWRKVGVVNTEALHARHWLNEESDMLLHPSQLLCGGRLPCANSVLTLETSWHDCFLTAELYWTNSPTVAFDKLARAIEAGFVLGMRVSLGNDQVHSLTRRLFDYEKANAVDDVPESPAVVKDWLDTVDGGLAIEQPVARQGSQCPRHRQFADARRTVNENQVHSESIPTISTLKRKRIWLTKSSVAT